MDNGCTFCGARIHSIRACPLYRNNFAMNSELQELKFNLTRQLFMLRILQRELQEQVQNEVPNEIQNAVREDISREIQVNIQNESNDTNDTNDTNEDNENTNTSVNT